jgi:hypothetical protein
VSVIVPLSGVASGNQPMTAKKRPHDADEIQLRQLGSSPRVTLSLRRFFHPILTRERFDLTDHAVYSPSSFLFAISLAARCSMFYFGLTCCKHTISLFNPVILDSIMYPRWLKSTVELESMSVRVHP